MQENKINEGKNSGINDNILLNKKRKGKKNEEVYIDNIRRLIKESGIDKNILKKKLFPKNEKDNKDKDNIKEDKIHISTSLKEWYQKINFIPESVKDNKNENENEELTLEEELNWFEEDDGDNNNKDNSIIKQADNGIISFNGNKNNTLYSHYIYLKDDYSFDISSKNKIYSWKIKFLSTSKLIGVGLTYKKIVSKNKNKFLDGYDSNFSNGVFALIQTYNPQVKKYCIRPWNYQDKNLVNHVAEFPAFKKGKEILIKYDTNKERIEFIMKKNVHIMGGIKLNGMDINNIMTPCVVFYYEGDEVLFSEFNSEDVNIINIDTNE